MTAGDADRPRRDHYVQSLERGLLVITAFDAEHQEMTLSEVARVIGLTRAATRRFLLTLVELGYMRFDGKKFRPTPRVLDLGYAYLSSLSLPGIAEPHLEWLVRKTQESSSMSVLEGDDIVYVARVPTSRIMSVSISVGTRFPAYATSMGRVLLAFLDDATLEEYLRQVRISPLTEHTLTSADELRTQLHQTRQKGYAWVDQELERGLRSIAVPVRNRQNRVVAAINVSAHVSRISKDKAKREFLPPLVQAAESIQGELT